MTIIMGIGDLLDKYRDLLVAAVLVCGTGLMVTTPWLPNGEEENGLPLAYGLRGEIAAANDIVIVDIDDIASAKGLPTSLKIRGVECDLAPGNKVRSFAGPMPRCLYSLLIDKIAAGSPDAIAVDVSFEKDGTPREDAALAAAIRDAGNVVLLRRIHSVIDPSTNILTEELENINPTIGNAAFAWAPFPLPKTTNLVNHFWSKVDTFGGLATLPTMALLAPYRDALEKARGDQPMEEFVRDLLQPRSPQPTRDIQLDEDALALITRLRQPSSYITRYFGRPGTVKIINAYDLMQTVTPPDFKNKTIFIGQVNLNTYQQADNFPTVYSQDNGIDLAGVEIAATVFSNLQNNTNLKRPAPWQSSLIVVIAGLTMIVVANRFKLRISLTMVLALLWIYTVIFIYAFSEHELWLPSIGLYTMAILAVPVGIFLQYGRFYTILIGLLPQRFRPKILNNEDMPDAPINIVGLCVKCDIENYTTASEESESGELSVAIDKFSKIVGGLVGGTGGEVYPNGDDSITVVWEIDREDKEVWRHIAPALFEMSKTPFVIETDDGIITRRNRIGITYGPFSLAFIGGDDNRTLNAQGTKVNIAARLEDLNKVVGTRILAEADLAPLFQNVVIQDHGTFKLKGISSEVSVIELQRMA